MGVGTGSGENRAVDAATNAINNPLLEDSHIEGATRILVNIYAAEMPSTVEVNDIMEIVTANAHPDVETIHGITVDETDEAMKDKITVTVIATGFPDDMDPIQNTVQNPGQPTRATPQSEPIQTSFLQNDFISASEWAKLQTPQQPSLPGLGPRNAGMPVMPTMPPLESEKTEAPRQPIRVQLPGANTDLDVPAYLRNKR